MVRGMADDFKMDLTEQANVLAAMFFGYIPGNVVIGKVKVCMIFLLQRVGCS